MSDDATKPPLSPLKPLRNRVVLTGEGAGAPVPGPVKKARVPILTINKPDRAHRSVPPGGPRPKTYARNIVAETFAARYGEDARADMLAEERASELGRDLATPSQRRTVIGTAGTKPADDKPATDRPREKKKRFFGL